LHLEGARDARSLLFSRAVSERLRTLGRRAALPLAIFAITALVYAVVAGPRALGPSENNHYVHLSESMLAGQLEQLGGRPPGNNDWTCYDSELHSVCRWDAFTHPRPSEHWYVSFPPFPSVVLLPAVAIFGRDFSDPLFWAIFAGIAPALLYVLLRRLREEKISPRTRRDDLILVTVFAFGSVYFFTAVQGSVWFAAHVVASALLCLYFLFAIGARRPFWAGLMLVLCFMTRPSVYPLAVFFLLEAMRACRRDDAPTADEGASIWRSLLVWMRGVQWIPTLKRCAIFAAPILAIGLLAMWMNEARFGDPFDFGHQYLMIRWRPRIEKWGLFNYHYSSKNLAVFCASLPWFSAVEPYLRISRHGLAFWVTMPNLLPAFWPKKSNALIVSLFIAVGAVALLDLCYQNSGWVQFGYRFSLDYMPGLIVLLALSRRRLGWGFLAVLVLAVAINTFGAITFDRTTFYDDDATQDRLFQPD
jgi:hypothetical protein